MRIIKKMLERGIRSRTLVEGASAGYYSRDVNGILAPWNHFPFGTPGGRGYSVQFSETVDGPKLKGPSSRKDEVPDRTPCGPLVPQGAISWFDVWNY